MNQYILKGKEAVACGDIKEWGEWFGKADRKVARETVDGVEVSTVFLGLDHSFGDGPPLLFETMVFGGEMDGDQDRCTTWEQAEEMHRAMVARVKGHNATGNGLAATNQTKETE